MRRFLSFVLIVGLVAMVAGCGQQTPEIKNSIPKPEGLTIRGTVRSINTAGGLIGSPLAGVVLVLDGQSTNKTDTTDSNGDYSFTSLGEGTYRITATLDGYQRNVGGTVTIGGGLQPTSDNTDVINDINMVDQPVVLSISPDPGVTVEAAAQTITVAFNEAMDPSTVRPALTTGTIRTLAIADTQTLTTSWSADSKTLTITTGVLLANHNYGLALDSGNNATDAAGNAIDTSGGTTSNAGGIAIGVYNSVAYRTASGGAPGAPTGLLLSINGKARGSIGYADVRLGTENVNLSWLTPSSGQISSYSIYVGTSSSGPWYLLGTSSNNTFSSTVTTVNTRLYGATYDPSCIKHMAFVTDAVHFNVVAANAEGESTGVTTSDRDAVEPQVFTWAVQDPTSLGISDVDNSLTDYSAAANLDMGCYLVFREPAPVNEPMDVSTLEDITKYTPSSSSIASASVVYNSAGTTVVEITFAAAVVPGGTVQVLVGPADLSGNTIDTTADTATIL